MNIIEVIDCDFVCEIYNEKTEKLSLSKDIFWNFVKKAHKNELSITIEAYAHYSDFSFNIRGEESKVKEFLIENYLGGDAEQFEDLNIQKIK